MATTDALAAAVASSPIPVPVTPRPGFWQREASHYPLPLTPFSRRVHRQTDWIRTACAEMGFLFDTLAFEDIGGWRYTRVIPIVDAGGPERRVATAVAAVRSDLPAQLVERWYTEWREELGARAAALRAVELITLTDEHLGRHLDAAIALADDGGQIHFRLHAALSVILGEFADTCRELLGWGDDRIFELLIGRSTASTEPAAALTALAGLLRRSPAFHPRSDTVEDLEVVLAADPEFAAGFADYLSRYGNRCLTYDVADPTLSEQPDIVLGLLRSQLDTAGADADAADRRERTAVHARELLAARGPGDRELFEPALTRASRAYPVREDNEHATVSVPLAVVRRAALEVGSRLVERAQLSAGGDVFFLEADEVSAALRDGTDRRPLVERRQGERAWILAHPGPASYGEDPGPPPAMNELPVEARQVNEAFVWAIDRILAPSIQVDNVPGHLAGIAASSGSSRGPVRVIKDESEFHKLRAGDVLVCPITSPVWSVLFPHLAGLITDSGGMLSHPAILAREFGIPAVVATRNATTLLRDGQTVVIDGTAGTVRIEP
jgi:rifampicin phosphotransferase